MTIKASSSQCPVDHSEDPELVQSFYRTVRSYALPRFPNIAVKTVHRWQQHLTGAVPDRDMRRCNLAEVGGAVSGPGVGEGGTAAVIVRDGATLGLLYIRWVSSFIIITRLHSVVCCSNERQAEAICDIVTCCLLSPGLEVGVGCRYCWVSMLLCLHCLQVGDTVSRKLLGGEAVAHIQSLLS